MQMNLSYNDAVMLWNDVVEMAHDCEDASMLPWLERLSPVSLENSVMTVSTRQNWTVRKIMGEYRPQIEQLLQDITLEPISLQVIVINTPGNTAPVAADDGGATPSTTMFHVKQSEQPASFQTAHHEDSAPIAPSRVSFSDETNFDTTMSPTGSTPSQAMQSPAVSEESFANQASSETRGMSPHPSPAALAGAARAAGRVGLFSRQPSLADRTGSDGTQSGTQTPTDTLSPGVTPANNPSFIDQKAASSPSYGLPQTHCAAPTMPEAAETSSAHPYSYQDDVDIPRFETLAEPEIVAQDAVVPILEDGAVPKAAVSSGYSDFNFDTYIVGEANKLAFSMALAVAEQPGSVANLNPLFIWGPSGNGKTHLLFSILNYLHDHQPGMNVQYVAANAFVDQYVDDIRNKRLRGKEVLKAYRAVDVLLVDDVQFFEDKQESVSTFFDIFNQLILDGKQIVLVADTPPDYLTLDDRMRTRFSSGLVVDIKAPTYEMKRSILQSYYERCRARMDWCHVEIPPKLFETLTQLAPDNPRNMQGLMTSILLKANDDPSVLSPEGIKEIIKDLFKTTEAISVASIIRVISDAYDVTADDIKGKPRTKNISEARQVVMWMARQLTDESYENIGAELGGRDHSTVYYGISTIEKRSIEDKSFLYKLERLKKEIVG